MFMEIYCCRPRSLAFAFLFFKLLRLTKDGTNLGRTLFGYREYGSTYMKVECDI